MPPTTRSTATKSSKPAAPAPPAEARVFLLTGAEAARKSAEAERLLKAHIDPDFADFDVETMDGNDLAADRVLSAAGTIALGVGKRVVIVRDTQQMHPDEQKKLAAGVGTISASGLLVLHTGSPVIEDGKTRKQSVVSTELANAVKKYGQVIEFTLPKADDLRGYLTQQARLLGKKLDPDALSILAQLPADDLGRVGSELEKVAAYSGDTPRITAQDVEAVLSRSPDDVIFKLCDAVGMRRTAEALGHVSTLFKGGGRPDAVAPRTLVLLARQIRLLAQFRYLGERQMVGRNAQPVSPDALAALPSDGAGSMAANPRMAWMSDRYVNQARNFTLPELTWRLERILHADLALKGIEPGGDSPQGVLQRLVVELCQKQ